MHPDRRIFWVEIYFDAEDVVDESQIGLVKSGLWKVVVWELDKNKEAILDSCVIRANRLIINEALDKGKQIKTEIEKSGFKCYMSHGNPRCKFPIRTAEYELIAYEVRPYYTEEEIFGYIRVKRYKN